MASSLEFSDFRHYSLGDDFRYIDWGLYGRTDKLYIKLFKEEYLYHIREGHCMVGPGARTKAAAHA